jgi:hypothetical protein
MNPTLYRDISLLLEPAKTSEKEGLKTAQFSFASETPYVRMDWERWELVEEVLKCDAEAIQGDRLQNGLIQFLWNHDVNAVRGVITSIDWRNGKGYAEAKFSRSPAAEQLYQDIQDEIIKGISLMYRVQEYEVLEKAVYSGTGWDAELISPEKVRATKWEIFEISAVSIPADATVGIGRSLKELDQIPTSVPKLIQTIGLKKVQQVVKEMSAEKEDVNQKFEYLELNQRYLETQTQLTTVTGERDVLKSQIADLQKQMGDYQQKAKLTDKYVSLKAQADDLVTAAKLSGNEYSEVFGKSLDELLKTEEPGAELRAMEIVLSAASKRSALLNTKKSQVPMDIPEDLDPENFLTVNGQELSKAAEGYQNAHKTRNTGYGI